jgi:hypothetical protein
MYSASVPIFVRMLGNLASWLDKAEAHAEARKFDSKLFLASKLAPDMLPFIKQIHIACDGPRIGLARLAGLEAAKIEDNETDFAQLRERIARTIEAIQAIPRAQIDGTEERDVTVPRRNGSMQFKGEAYLQTYLLPNFFFHVTTAYALLRQGGVELGKGDYLGAF